MGATAIGAALAKLGLDKLQLETVQQGAVSGPSELKDLLDLKALTFADGDFLVFDKNIDRFKNVPSPLEETRGGTGESAYITGDILYSNAANALARRAAGTTGRSLTMSGGVPNWVAHSRTAHSFGYFRTFNVTPTPQAAPLGDITITTSATPVYLSSGTTILSGLIAFFIPGFICNLRTSDVANRSVDFWYEFDQDDGNGFVQRTGKYRAYIEASTPARRNTAVGISLRDLDDLLWWNGGIAGPTPGLGDGSVYVQCVGQVVEAGGSVIASDRHGPITQILRES